MKIQILMSPGCGHGKLTCALVEEVRRTHAAAATIETILVSTPKDAARLAFPGSPTVLVNGIDIEQPVPANVGLG